jgi:hypothetical protein
LLVRRPFCDHFCTAKSRKTFSDHILRSCLSSPPEELIMILTRIALIAAMSCVAAPAIAQNASAPEAMPDTAGGRYLFSKQSGGQANAQADAQGNAYVRLDTQTGAVSLCSQKPVGWACEAVPEDRAALENEIARLQTENAALKKDILARGLPLPAGIMPEPSTAQSGEDQNSGITLHLPSDADIDRMVAFAGHVWQRLVDAVERAQKQFLNKS